MPQRCASAHFLGSGLSKDNVRQLLSHADGAIVGSYFKKDGNWKNEIDSERTKAFMQEVKALRKELG